MIMRDLTTETAMFWAETGTDVLFDEGDPFNGEVSKETLKLNIYNRILINIIDHETYDISEAQLQECINNSKN
jgi:hypothetical protein